MPESRYPTLEEFWKRLDTRDVEPDLRDQLQERTRREERAVHRLPAATTVAVMARLLPETIPAEALAAFVDEFFDRQLGRCNETAGLLPRDQLIPLGFSVLDDTASGQHGARFADLADHAQDRLLAAAERGEIAGPDGFDSSRWFQLVRNLALLPLGSDPRGHGVHGLSGPELPARPCLAGRGGSRGPHRPAPGLPAAVKPLEVIATPARMRRHDGRVDVCIVGCGAAGSVLAKELAERGWRVVVLEAEDWLTTDDDLRQDEVEMRGKFDWDDRRWFEGSEELEMATPAMAAGWAGEPSTSAGCPCGCGRRTSNGAAATA